MKGAIYATFVLLAGCAGKVPPPAIQIVPQRVTVEVQRPCPVTIPTRPAPLAKPLPTDAVALAAIVLLKLREFSGPGQWADQATDALRICTQKDSAQ